MDITVEDLMHCSLQHPDTSKNLGIGRIGAVVVGDAVTVNMNTPTSSPSMSLDAKPGGSTTTVSGMSITPDTQGVYSLTLTVGGMKRSITIVAVPSQMKTYGPAAGAWRDFLERRVNAPNATSTAAIANISTSTPFPWLTDSDKNNLT